MSITVMIRNGQKLLWKTLKRLAQWGLQLDIPVVRSIWPIFSFLYALHVAVREAGLCVLSFFWYEPLFRSQCTSVCDGLRMEQLPYMGGRGRLILGLGGRLSGKSSIGLHIHACATPELIIGDGTYIGYGCRLSVARSIRVGRHCLLSGETRVADHDGHPLDAERRPAGEPPSPEEIRPVVIGNDVWIGAVALIMKGVIIGDRTIAGAGSGVTRDVPPDVIVAGKPARVVRQLPGAFL